MEITTLLETDDRTALRRWLINHQNNLTFGISSNVMFLSSALEGDRLRAEAASIEDHRMIPAVEVRVTSQAGRLICHVNGMGYRKDVPLG